MRTSSLVATRFRLAFALFLLSLLPLALVSAQTDDKKKPDLTIDKRDAAILRNAKLSTDAETLHDFLKKRTLPEKDRPELERLVRKLASSDYRTRERAMHTLEARGSAALDVLRAYRTSNLSMEAIRRIERAIENIQLADVSPEVPAAAIRVLALHKPAALVETLLAYVPFADNDVVMDELRDALTKHALDARKASPHLLAALADRAPQRRALAAEVLSRAVLADHKEAVRKLLKDDDSQVRFRTARALIYAKDRDAIPVLIDALPDLPLNAGWQAEDLLLHVALGTPAPSAPYGNDKDTRDKCKAGWLAWWKTHGAKVDLAKLAEPPRLLGRTLIVLLDQGSVLELGPDRTPRWELKNIVFPLDAQVIDDDRVLVAEYHANRVTERSVKGNGDPIWQKAVTAPLAAQRLSNGNTFVLTDRALLEFDKDGRETMNISFDGELRKIMKAMKLESGEIVCMQADARIVRYDAQGREVSSFTVNLGTRLFGGRIHMLPTGRVLIPHAGEGKVIEYDAKGKAVWEVAFEQPIAATRLPNGNTLITSMNASVGAIEVDRAGNEVWSYRDPSNTRVTRAIRR